ncbi:MAG TPA: class I SAM-dependent methyltransferase [Rickettsiales bacterium]|nr:class I SAM-dependent methyltransferase [Rickettsiales bacterium]
MKSGILTNKTIEELNKSNESYLLFMENNKLFLKSKIHKDWLPFCIDFSDKELLRRKEDKNQEIIKAIGIKNDYKPKILDTTAGLGRDSFILANFGCQVVMLERNPIIYLLLSNALENANSSAITNNLELINTDSIKYLQKLKETFDVIYIDPMFPKTKKSRLVKKDMQIFREIVGDDFDSGKLLELALQQNVKRVVVKRMRKSDFLLNKKPNFEIIGNTTRFDVYTPNNNKILE